MATADDDDVVMPEGVGGCGEAAPGQGPRMGPPEAEGGAHGGVWDGGRLRDGGSPRRWNF